jgi:hypothetical protein
MNELITDPQSLLADYNKLQNQAPEGCSEPKGLSCCPRCPTYGECLGRAIKARGSQARRLLAGHDFSKAKMSLVVERKEQTPDIGDEFDPNKLEDKYLKEMLNVRDNDKKHTDDDAGQ